MPSCTMLVSTDHSASHKLHGRPLSIVCLALTQEGQGPTEPTEISRHHDQLCPGSAAVQAVRWQQELTANPAYPGTTVGNAALLTRGVIPHSYVIWLGVGVLLVANLLFQFVIWASSKHLHGMLLAGPYNLLKGPA